MRRRLVAAPMAVGVMLAGTLALVPGTAKASVTAGLGLVDAEEAVSQQIEGSKAGGEADDELSLAVVTDPAFPNESSNAGVTTNSGWEADGVSNVAPSGSENEHNGSGEEGAGDADLSGEEGSGKLGQADDQVVDDGLTGKDGGGSLADDSDGNDQTTLPEDDVEPASEGESGSGAVDGVSSSAMSNVEEEDSVPLDARQSSDPEDGLTSEKTQQSQPEVVALSENAIVADSVQSQVTNVQLYRLYNPNSGEHFYTSSINERDTLNRLGWVYEGDAWVSPSISQTATYRLYNPNSGDHHFTTDKYEYDVLGSIGWVKEGLAWYGAAADGVALFRLFNPNVSVGTHHFTSSALERLRMVSDGWVYEGIAWYGVDLGPVAPTNATPNTWVDNGGSRFYIGSNGAAVTGWQTIGGTKYHFDSKGRMSTGVTDVDGTIYSFSSSGTLNTAWQKLSGYWYYFDNSTGALRRDGWFVDGGKTYYLDPTSGAMATGTRWIDGYLRSFDSSGACLKTGYQTKWGNLMLAARNVTLPGYAQGSYWSYVHPCTIGAGATREQVIEAFINAAYDYQRAGTRWVDNNCGAPGTTVDCSGLVMESLYAVGMDLTGVAGGDFNPYSKYYWNHHFANTWRLNNTFQPISISQLERGDIIYYSGHVVIYLGNGRILESTPYASNVRESSMYSPGTILGCARPFTK